MWRYGLMILILLGAGWAFYPQAPEPQPQAMPEVAFTLPDGKAAKLSDYRGKTVIVHFWASWCPPCLPELPEMVKLAEAHPDNLIILAFSLDKTADDMQLFLKTKFPTLPANFIAMWDAQGSISHDSFYSTTYPESYIIGCDGSLRDKVIGPANDWDGTLAPHLAECSK